MPRAQALTLRRALTLTQFSTVRNWNNIQNAMGCGEDPQLKQGIAELQWLIGETQDR